ncbi:P-loop containing nucleoside triphosphate hydrolase protein, partial [Metschnikowia bicuspidata var. bicuspidata NRRL YB-4993]
MEAAHEYGAHFQNGDPLSGDLQNGDLQNGDSQNGDSQNGDSQNGDSQNGDSQNGDSQNGDSQNGDSQNCESQYGDPQYDDPHNAIPENNITQSATRQSATPPHALPENTKPQNATPQNGAGEDAAHVPVGASPNAPEYDEIELAVTESQHRAIAWPAHMDQLLRIRAGPGSGKTFTLVARVAHILSQGTRPDEVLVLSMANRSVDSLKDTLARLVGRQTAGAVEIATFHAFCAGLLDQHGSLVSSSYSKQAILDDATWKTMVAFFLGRLVKFGGHTIGGTITPARLDKALSSIMLGLASPAQVAAEHKLNADYLARLAQHLRLSGMVRYDEIIADATHLMRHSASVLRAPGAGDAPTRALLPRLAHYKAVLIDEFQDVYPALAAVIRCIVEYPTAGLAARRKHLTITGDSNQSIYDFLGAHELDMARFPRKLPRMDVVDHRLQESFRCTQPILDAAVDVALKDASFRPRATRADACAQRPVLLEASSVVEEYHRVADEIVRLLCLLGGLVHLDDIAILARTNAAATAMQAVLKSRFGLAAHKLSLGNQWVASRMHILKHVLGVISGESGSSVSLMSILLNLDSMPGSRVRVSRVFSESLAKSAPGDAMFLEAYLFDELLNPDPKASALAALYAKHPAALERIAAFLNQVQTERQLLADAHATSPLAFGPVALVACLQRMAALDGIAQYLRLDANETSKASPLEILESFNNSIHHAFGKYSARPELHTTTFLDYFLQTYDSDVINPVGNSITVSTIHSAKGLEFPIVFVLG